MHRLKVPFGPPLISEDDIDEVVKVLRSGWIGTGPKDQEFERALETYLSAKHVVTTNSCTAALHLSLLTLDLKPGDEVITTPMTFAATANVIVHTGAKPVFADIKSDDWNIDTEEISKHITAKTRAILPVHLTGMPCDLHEIEEIADAHGLAVVEDAAHALGARYRGEMVGKSRNLTCFSFYPTKNITTIEGGAVSTADAEKAELISILRLHGQSADAWQRYSSGKAQSYKVTRAGYKYNMTDVQAALGLKQLEKIDRFLKARQAVANVYFDELSKTPGVILPMRAEAGKSRVWHLYPILLQHEKLGVNRDDAIKRLNALGIGTGIHYESLNLHPFYQQTFGYNEGMFPEAEYVSSRTLSLPMGATITQAQAQYVASSLKSIIETA